MPFISDIQLKTTLKENILENLTLIKRIHGFNQTEIYAALGYEKDPFSKLKSDENYFGSPQLLAGLKLLIRLETLQQENETLRQKLADIGKGERLRQELAGYDLNEKDKMDASTTHRMEREVSYSKGRRKFSPAGKAVIDEKISKLKRKRETP